MKDNWQTRFDKKFGMDKNYFDGKYIKTATEVKEIKRFIESEVKKSYRKGIFDGALMQRELNH